MQEVGHDESYKSMQGKKSRHAMEESIAASSFFSLAASSSDRIHHEGHEENLPSFVSLRVLCGELPCHNEQPQSPCLRAASYN